MKILTKRQVRKALMLITANEIIAKSYMPMTGDGIRAWEQMMKNSADLAFMLHGIPGITTVRDNAFDRFCEKGGDDDAVD